MKSTRATSLIVNILLKLNLFLIIFKKAVKSRAFPKNNNHINNFEVIKIDEDKAFQQKQII